MKVSFRWTLTFTLAVLSHAPLPPQPLTHPLETNYVELAPYYEVKSVGGCTHCSASAMAFDQTSLIDEHQKLGCGAWPNIFSSDALAQLSLSFLPLFGTLAQYPEGSRPFVNLHGMSHHAITFVAASLQVSLSAPLCPSLWLYIYLLSD